MQRTVTQEPERRDGSSACVALDGNRSGSIGTADWNCTAPSTRPLQKLPRLRVSNRLHRQTDGIVHGGRLRSRRDRMVNKLRTSWVVRPAGMARLGNQHSRLNYGYYTSAS